MPIKNKTKTLNRWKKTGLLLLSVAAVYTLIGFFVIPPVFKSVLAHKLSARLHRKVSIQSVDVNPFVLSVTINKLKVRQKNASATFASIDKIYANFQAVSLFKGAWVSKTVTVTNLYVDLIRSAPHQYNISDLLKRSPAQRLIKYFSLNNIKLEEGTIHFQDIPANRSHVIDNINLSIPFVSNLTADADIWVMPHFSAVINGSPITLTGETKPFLSTRKTNLTVNVNGIDVPKYLPYFPVAPSFDVQSALLNLDLKFTYEDIGGLPSITIGGGLTLKRLKAVDERGNPLLAVPSLSVHGAAFDWRQRRLVIRQLESDGGKVHLIRYKDGALNLLTLVSSSGLKREEGGTARAGSPAKPWEVSLAGGTLQHYSASMEDRSTSTPVSLKAEELTLDLQDLTTVEKKHGKISLSFRSNKQGTVSIEGGVGVKPVFADLEVKVDNVDMTFVQPYLWRQIRADLTSGNLSIDGNLLVGRRPTAEGIGLSYLGEFALKDVSAAYGGRQILKWKKLEVAGIDYGNGPLHLSVQDVSLNDYYAFVRIDSAGGINVREIFRPEETNHRQPKDPKNAAASGEQNCDAGTPRGTRTPSDGRSRPADFIQIGQMHLTGGQIDFTDRNITPHFRADIDGLQGAILGLTSEDGAEATIDLQGKMNGVAPLALQGKVGPLGGPLHMDMQIHLKGMDMTRLSPFARKYVGYTLEKGNLSLNLNYVIVKRKLDSDNEFLLDELTLGRKVASQDAVSLPIKEAISLLKDRRGEIKLKVPVSGDLGDPRFHPGRIIWKTVKSLISKAVTSPFTVLASLVDWHGETLNYVEFPYGSADITPQAGAKLDELAKALYERPNLNLDVEGYVSPEHDRQALREKYFKRKLKIQKLKELTRNGRSGLSLGQVRIERDEYQKYLKMAYKSEISREKSGERHDAVPDASRSQMEGYLLSRIDVGDEGLRLLAQKRANSVRKYILNGSDITPDRFFIVAPESLAPTEKPGESDSRAVMAIR